MSDKKEKPIQKLQEEILNQFREIGIEGHIGCPHLQREHACLILPNKDKEEKLILR